MGSDHQAQQESYIEIYQQYPNNRANTQNIKIVEAKKLKFFMKLDK